MFASIPPYSRTYKAAASLIIVSLILTLAGQSMASSPARPMVAAFYLSPIKNEEDPRNSPELRSYV